MKQEETKQASPSQILYTVSFLIVIGTLIFTTFYGRSTTDSLMVSSYKLGRTAGSSATMEWVRRGYPKDFDIDKYADELANADILIYKTKSE